MVCVCVCVCVRVFVTNRARREDDDARLALLEERLEQRDQEEVALPTHQKFFKWNYSN